MSGETDSYPLEVNELSTEESEEVFKHFSASKQDGFVRIGPKGYFFTNGFLKDAAQIYNLPLRPDDIWVITFPKSGTTWLQELVWLLATNFDYATAEAVPLVARFPFLEISMITNGKKAQAAVQELSKGFSNSPDASGMGELMAKFGLQQVLEMPSPRFIKSHLPLSLLPQRLLHCGRVVCVARDPRDVALSFYHHNKMFKLMGYTGDFKQFWNLFIKDMLDWTPYFENVKEAWEKRNDPNLLFLFYEDLLKVRNLLETRQQCLDVVDSDLPAAVRKVADFLGKVVTDEQVCRLCDHLSFHNFKNNKSVNFEFGKELGLLDKDQSFVRKGKAGGWRENFDEEMTRQAEQWIANNLRDTDLRFPTIGTLLH